MKQDLLFGYGSLMSHDSRLTHSEIDEEVLPVSVDGWYRGWSMSSSTEYLTCVGAKPGTGACGNSSMNGVLVPIDEISEDLRQREQHYRFVEVDKTAIKSWHAAQSDKLATWLSNATVWICEVEKWQAPSETFPVCQTYVDTCLVGCIEQTDLAFADQFIELTSGWHHHWVNDRQCPEYPRRASITKTQMAEIDALLAANDLLKYRKEPE
ncbi:MAG: hypothetical protein GJ680_05770 [Alteromonadaceae bacterium]|nr:hypothetical protein [Alteromonadaceae bacterium]